MFTFSVQVPVKSTTTFPLISIKSESSKNTLFINFAMQISSPGKLKVIQIPYLKATSVCQHNVVKLHSLSCRKIVLKKCKYAVLAAFFKYQS